MARDAEGRLINPDSNNPLRAYLLGMDGVGILVKYPAWVPTRHPMTGERINVLATVTDRMVSAGTAADMEDWFEMEPITGTADDFYDSDEVDNGAL